MNTLTLASAVFELATCGTNLPHRQDSFDLLPHVKSGEKFIYEYKSSFEAGQMKGSFNATFELTVGSLAPKETITFQTAQRNAEFAMNGQTMKQPDANTTTKFKLNGELISSEPAFASSEQARFSALMQIVVPTERAVVGSKWKWKTAPSALNGNIGLSGTGECLAFEQKNGMHCAKLRLSSKETSGDTPAESKMEVWVSTKDGLPVETVMEMMNAPLAKGMLANLKSVNKRK